MKKILFVFLLASSISVEALAADPATVNGVVIKQSLVDYIVKDAAAHGKKIDVSALTGIIEKLITTELIDQEAKKSGIDKQPDFQAKQELTLQELRVGAFIEDYIQKNPIDEKALQAEYDRLKSLNPPKEYKASHILVKTEAEANAIIARLGKGESFAQLAKDNSLDGSKESGGDIGWFSAEGVVQPFADAVAQLQKGSYTQAPVQTEYGWHVIRLDDTRDTEPPTFDTVKDQLRGDMQRQQLEKLVAGLRAKAKVVNNKTQ